MGCTDMRRPLAILLVLASLQFVLCSDFSTKDAGNYIFVTSTSAERLALVYATRLWRGTVPAYVAVNCPALVAAHNAYLNTSTSIGVEHYAHFADDEKVANNPGVHRIAMAPALAAAKLSNTSYKWMLYGDDDTVFIMGNVHKLLQGYDHTLPILLSDSYWNALDVNGGMTIVAHHPSKTAPRCLPCHYNTSQLNLDKLPIRANVGCPCTPELACSKTQLPTKGNWTHKQCLQQSQRWHVYGGSGMIISRGLADMMAKHRGALKECITKRYTYEYGDRALTSCLFEMGIAPTDPGPYLVGSYPEPMFGTFQRGNEMVPVEFFRQALDNARKQTGKMDMAVRNRLVTMSRMVSWHGRAGAPGRRLSHVVADISMLTSLMLDVRDAVKQLGV